MVRRRQLMGMQKKGILPPEGYRFIEYAQRHQSGSAYFDLPYGFDKTDTVEVKGSIDPNQYGESWLVGPKTWNNNTNRFSMLGKSANKFAFAFGSWGTPNSHLIPEMAKDSNVHIATYANLLFRIESSEMDVTGATFNGATDNLRLFYGYSPCWGSIYYFKQTKITGEKVYVLPVQNITTGDVEMYETVSKSILPRLGTFYPPEE